MPRYKWPQIKAIAARASKVSDLMRCFTPQIYHPADGPMRKWMKAAERILIVECRNLVGRESLVPKGEPVDVHILCVFEMPKSRHRKTKRAPSERCTKKNRGDVDNLMKPILDAATGVLWHDDSQIASATLEKIVGSQGEEPRLEIIVRPSRPMTPGEFRTDFENLMDTLNLGAYAGLSRPPNGEPPNARQRDESSSQPDLALGSAQDLEQAGQEDLGSLDGSY